MVVRGLLEQSPLSLQVLNDFFVCIEDVLAREVGDQVVELALIVDRDVGRDSGSEANPLVVFTIGGSLVNDAGAVFCADVVIDKNLPRVGGLKLGFVFVVIEQALVAKTCELLAEHRFGDCC